MPGSGDDIPADVIGLVAAGQKIRAIKRYRELTGASLREAKAVVIDGPDHEHAILLRRTIDDQG